MKKILSIAIVLAVALSLMSVAAFSSNAASSMTVYKFTFETPNCGSILKKAGEFVGDVVEYPAGSGNHALRYEINATTRTGGGGAHPYIWPNAIGGCLAVQGSMGSNSITFKCDMATDGPTAGSYMYPFMLINEETECYFQSECGIYYPGSNTFKTCEWSLDQYDDQGSFPLNGQANGGIAFCDEATLDEGTYIYLDNVELIWNGTWRAVTEGGPAYPESGAPAEIVFDSASSSDTNITTRPPEPSNVTNPPLPSDVSGTGLAGDANNDGEVNMKDILMIRKVMASVSVTGYNASLADFNKDGEVNMKDILGIRKKMAGV